IDYSHHERVDATSSGRLATNASPVSYPASLTSALNTPVLRDALPIYGSYSLDTTNAAYQHLAAGATTDVVASYTVTDGLGGSDNAARANVVTAVNDAPGGQHDRKRGIEGATISGSVATNGSDVDDVAR